MRSSRAASPSPCHSVIFLVGFRGTGKTTVARLLAERIGWPWADADAVIEEQTTRNIRQIFTDEGEAGFRIRETAILDELCRRQRVVIATGGGVILNPANRERMRQAGHVVWLIADAATLERRLQSDPATADRRPNLTGGGLSEIEELLQQREPLYRACADQVIDTTRRAPEEVVEMILAAWNAEPRTPNA